jgi:hypothetical protein
MGSVIVRVWQYDGPAEADLPQAFTLQCSGRYLGDLHVDFRMLKDFSVESLAALNMKIAWDCMSSPCVLVSTTSHRAWGNVSADAVSS